MKITTFNVLETFSKDGVIKMLTGVEAINQGLKVLLLTKRGELFGDPEFGSMLNEKSYNLMNVILKDILSDHIIKLISNYDHRIIVNKLEISYVNSDTAVINIDYSFGSATSRLTVNILTEV